LAQPHPEGEAASDFKQRGEEKPQVIEHADVS
jgi:hypothetical protein